MSRFQKPYTRWWLSLCSLGLAVCLVYAAVVVAQTQGAPKELKLGFVDFFSGSAAIFGVSGRNAADQVGRWPKPEEVLKAFEELTWQTPIGPVTMRADHQAVLHAGVEPAQRAS
jgi:hypothetical protein